MDALHGFCFRGRLHDHESLAHNAAMMRDEYCYVKQRAVARDDASPPSPEEGRLSGNAGHPQNTHFHRLHESFEFQ